MAVVTDGVRKPIAAIWCALAVLVCVVATPLAGDAASAATRATSSTPSKPSKASKSTPFSVPKTTVEQDSRFFTEVAEADKSLQTYEQSHANLALEALLTDGSAFCALLKREGGIDNALVAEAEGVRSTESQTSIPLSVTTFNTIESVALLTLCPSEQKLVPASVRSKLKRLGDQLAKPSG